MAPSHDRLEGERIASITVDHWQSIYEPRSTPAEGHIFDSFLVTTSSWLTAKPIICNATDTSKDAHHGIGVDLFEFGIGVSRLELSSGMGVSRLLSGNSCLDPLGSVGVSMSVSPSCGCRLVLAWSSPSSEQTLLQSVMSTSRSRWSPLQDEDDPTLSTLGVRVSSKVMCGRGAMGVVASSSSTDPAAAAAASLAAPTRSAAIAPPTSSSSSSWPIVQTQRRFFSFFFLLRIPLGDDGDAGPLPATFLLTTARGPGV